MSNQECIKRTAGGKGNLGKFIDRNPRLCAAGVPTRQPEITLPDGLQQFLLVDEVNALLSDAIVPPPPPRPLGPLFYPIQKDQRNSCIETSELAKVINPPRRTKFQTLVDDLKESTYASYWKNPIGRRPDCTPLLPDGFDIEGTTFGRKNKEEPALFDVIYPVTPLKGFPPSKEAGLQTNRNYCKPAFNPDLTYGHRSMVDKRGKLMKCALSDDSVVVGKGEIAICNSVKVDREEAYESLIGKSVAPYNNISQMPEGHRFGKILKSASVKECLASCDLNPGRDFFLDCLGHINSVRKGLKKLILPSFFKTFYNNLKYMDKEKTGWLPAEEILEFALTKHIRVDIKLLGPLLEAWHAFDGKNVKYQTFCDVLNFKRRLPELPKIEDVPPECLDFHTTYRDMTKPGQDPGPYFMAGRPSGRYFDKDYPDIVEGQCSAHKAYLPMETDMYACLQPSVLSLLHVTHRDMYAKREPHVVKRIFEAAGEKFTEERFSSIWEEAKKYHSQGLVCYETFRKALAKFPEDKNGIEKISNILEFQNQK